MGAVLQRGKKWAFTFYVRLPSGERERVRESGFLTRRSAELAMARRVREEAECSEVPHRRRVTVADFAPRYIAWKQRNGRPHESDAGNLVHVVRHMGDVMLGRVDADAVERYQQARLAERSERTGTTPRPATVNREVRVLSHLLTVARRERLLPSGFRLGARHLPEDNVRDRVIEEHELLAVLGQMPARHRPVVVLAWETGMRRGEVVALRWTQVDLDRGFVRLGGATKNKRPRSVPLSEAAVACLAALPRASERVFPGIKGSAVTTAWVRATRRAGVEGARLHDLRHSRITAWRRAGHDFHRIMAASGHLTESVFRRYSHVNEHELRSMVAVSTGVPTGAVSGGIQRHEWHGKESEMPRENVALADSGPAEEPTSSARPHSASQRNSSRYRTLVHARARRCALDAARRIDHRAALADPACVDRATEARLAALAWAYWEAL